VSAVAAKPRRSLRNELFSLVAVLSVPAAIVAVFPHGAVGFVAEEDPGPSAATCAFVKLTEDQVASATENAHAAWRVSAEGVRRLRSDLSVTTLPEERPCAVMDIASRTPLAAPGRESYATVPLPPTLAAPKPARIGKGKAERSPAADAVFPRSELLSLDPVPLSAP
jgi:hypothetical protein